MFFALLVLFAAFLIESIGTYVSVVGLAALFSSNPVIITLAISLDVGKVVAVSFLYKYWSKIGFIMKTYMTLAAIVLMVITSTGAFGYLSAEFQKAIKGTNENTVLIASMEEEKTRLQARKEEIDNQIAAIPPTYITGRRQIISSFAPEVERLNARLAQIDEQLPQMKIDSIKKNVEVGPIIYVAEAFGTTPEQAVKWVILVIIFVFDPLAVSLLIAGNFLIEHRSKLKNVQHIANSAPLDSPRTTLGDIDSTTTHKPNASAAPPVISASTTFETLSVPLFMPPEIISKVAFDIDHNAHSSHSLSNACEKRHDALDEHDLRPGGASDIGDDDIDAYDADSYHTEYGGSTALDSALDSTEDHEQYHVDYGGATATEEQDLHTSNNNIGDGDGDGDGDTAIRHAMPSEFNVETAREVITREQLIRPQRCSLESISNNADVTVGDQGQVSSGMQRIYKDS